MIRMPSRWPRLVLTILLTFAALPLRAAEDAPAPGSAPGSAPGTAPAPASTRIRVAQVSYADGKLASCFSSGFLDLAARDGQLEIDRTLGVVPLGSDEIFTYPLLIMAGDGDFTLSGAERDNLRQYLERGGLILASASCSNQPWAARFTGLVGELFPDAPLTDLPLNHPIFHMLYDIEALRSQKPATEVAIRGLSLQGRLAVIFSPLGLNDTDAAGAGCCCCGGNEMRESRLINANIVAYALTH